jgi:hypothetical protein
MIQLTAVQYRQTLLSGHSCPCLIEAETLEGERYEVVLKLKGSVHGGGAGLARELVASQLAAALSLRTPTPFVVEITQEFAESVSDPEARRRFLENLGRHHASENLGAGWNAVLYGARLPHKLIDPAAAVVAFDALVRNDDRHVEKANYLIRGSTVMLIDHERAFPPPQVGAGPLPWEEGGLTFLRTHAFFAGVRGQLPDFEPVPTFFEALTAEQLSAMVGEIPEEWDAGGIAAELEGYLVALHANFRNVLNSVRNLLQ